MLPLSTEACALVVMLPMVIKLPGTLAAAAVVVDADAGCVVAMAISLPTPRPVSVDCGVMESVRVWLPLVDSACTGGGTSLWGRVGGELSQPSASSAVPMVPRSIVCESDWASTSW